MAKLLQTVQCPKCKKLHIYKATKYTRLAGIERCLACGYIRPPRVKLKDKKKKSVNV